MVTYAFNKFSLHILSTAQTATRLISAISRVDSASRCKYMRSARCIKEAQKADHLHVPGTLTCNATSCSQTSGPVQ